MAPKARNPLQQVGKVPKHHRLGGAGVRIYNTRPFPNKPGIRRLMRRSGVKRIAADAYPEARAELRVFLATIMSDAITFAKHGRRKTVTALDVVYALKRLGGGLYGFGGYGVAVRGEQSVGQPSSSRRPTSLGMCVCVILIFVQLVALRPKWIMAACHALIGLGSVMTAGSVRKEERQKK